jgi:CHAD domain-containing protein
MDKGKIKRIINKHYRAIKKYIKKIEEGFNAASIHQFRVGYKKLRAFLRMLSQKDKAKGKIKMAEKLKKVYTIAGNIRDLQLQQQRVSAAAKQIHKKPQAYLTIVQKKIEQLKPAWLVLSPEKTVAESKRKTDALLPKKISPLLF